MHIDCMYVVSPKLTLHHLITSFKLQGIPKKFFPLFLSKHQNLFALVSEVWTQFQEDLSIYLIRKSPWAEEPWLIGTVLARNIRWVWFVCAFFFCSCFCSLKPHAMQIMALSNSTDSNPILLLLLLWNPTMEWRWRRREIFPVWGLGEMTFLVGIRGKSVQAPTLYTTDKYPPAS